MIEAKAFAGSPVAVFGLGRSGLAAARALAAGGAKVRAWDDDPAQREIAATEGVVLDDLYAADWHGVRALVLSPGVPVHHPEPHEIVRLAHAHGAQILGDVELFSRERLPARVAAITGTNGKSTTAALTVSLLRACGIDGVVGANFGDAVLNLPPLGEAGIYVLELSSYQIDLTTSLSADVAVLLNLAPDHLERHGGMAGYVAAKKRLFDLQAPEQIAVVGLDDSESRSLFDELVGAGREVTPVSGIGPVEHGIYVDRGILHDARTGTPRKLADLREGALKGAHNWQNAAAALAVTAALGCDEEVAASALLDFPGLPHRLEQAAEFAGVRFVNDSKATNAAAAAQALAVYDDIYWIAGGRPKEQGIGGLAHLLPHVRRAFLIGEAAEAFAAALGGAVPVTRSGTLQRAVRDAFAAAKAEGRDGAVILLSPACASFDQFADFEARGDLFRDLARELEETA